MSLIITQFALATLLPSIATFALAKIERQRNWNYWAWQIFCGIVFGAIAILGTEFGIVTNDATMNVRDAAPIAASLYFGAPAGIIAGVIGGVERWFAALWGRGMFTRIACSVATCASGIYASLMRTYIFEGRKPGWLHGSAIAVTAEVLHLLLIFLTNINAVTRAYMVVEACTYPMIACNAIAVSLAAFASAKAEGTWRRRQRPSHPSIAQVMQSRLLAVMIAGFFISSLFTTILQASITYNRISNLLSTALDDARNDIYKASDDNLLGITNRIASEIYDRESATQETIDRLLEEFGVSEIHFVDEKGIIVASSDQRYIGYDMASGAQSSEFLMLLPGGGAAQLVQDYQPMSYDKNVWRKYAGKRVDDGFVQVGYDGSQFLEDLGERVDNGVRNRHVGQDGMLVVITSEGTLAGTRSDLHPEESDIAELVRATNTIESGDIGACQFMGKPYYVSYRSVEGFQIFSLISEESMDMDRGLSTLIMNYMEVLMFAALFAAVYLIIRNKVVQSIWQVNDTLDDISQGDLKATVEVTSTSEFASLSQGINTMVESLRHAIEAEATRIDQELDYARAIQEGALPRTFPPFPEVDAFDIYARMTPARVVGGDFYDFFLVNDHTLGFLIADVSGKGIPASLFMMAAKVELSTYMTNGMSLPDAVQATNWHLCQGNDSDMFVTIWAAMLDYDTGELTYVNAGHNPPLLRHDGTWSWLREKSGLFLGAFDSTTYRSHTITLEPEDQLLLYTDGVNEAFSADDEEYGNGRLEAFAASHANLHPQDLVNALHEDVMDWARGVPQSDDITILSLEYGVPPQAEGSITVPATIDQLENVLGFIREALRDRACPLATQDQLDIVIEELFVNVCSYAYEDQDEPGTATINYVYTVNPSRITIGITDSGKPFNPLWHADPKKPSSIGEAKVGGLGIMMVKRMTDDLSYIRDGDKNVVAFVKRW
ncbi:MAG: SpoIIE family protein phosphatase [Atopobiaceae bacterium]|nr:SpoIIE family protein phosphatase [Atopobiaceae bacterium]